MTYVHDQKFILLRNNNTGDDRDCPLFLELEAGLIGSAEVGLEQELNSHMPRRS